MVALTDPLIVRRLSLKNRLVLPPMQTGLASERGEVTERLLEHYARRADGPGLVIIEHSYVSKDGQLSQKQLGIYDDSLIFGLARLVESVHRSNVPVAIQINHAGRLAGSKITGTQPVAPSPIPASEEAESPRELSVQEIEIIAERFVSAADRAVEAGFDAVEIHGAHGFLLSQFLSPLTNRRTDEYGKDLEGRMRFPLEVVRKVRAELGDLPLLYRLGADDQKPNGLTLSDSRKVAVELASEGVDIIDVSGGLSGSRPPGTQGEGYMVHLAEGIKSVVKIPVIAVGGVVTATFADRVIRDGKADLVAVGRAMLNDPDWATKAIRSL